MPGCGRSPGYTRGRQEFICHLLAHGGVTVKALMRRLKVSDPTVHRDLVAIRSRGVKVRKRRIRSGESAGEMVYTMEGRTWPD